jgi:hypothetical protein
MRKGIVGAMVSLDGVMQAPGGPAEDPTGGFKYGGWVAPLGGDPFSTKNSARCSGSCSVCCSGVAPTISATLHVLVFT